VKLKQWQPFRTKTLCRFTPWINMLGCHIS